MLDQVHDLDSQHRLAVIQDVIQEEGGVECVDVF